MTAVETIYYIHMILWLWRYRTERRCRCMVLPRCSTTYTWVYARSTASWGRSSCVDHRGLFVYVSVSMYVLHLCSMHQTVVGQRQSFCVMGSLHHSWYDLLRQAWFTLQGILCNTIIINSTGNPFSFPHVFRSLVLEVRGSVNVYSKGSVGTGYTALWLYSRIANRRFLAFSGDNSVKTICWDHFR